MQQLRAAGWPAAFIFLYDEIWVHVIDPLFATFAGLLGDGVWMEPDLNVRATGGVRGGIFLWIGRNPKYIFWFWGVFGGPFLKHFFPLSLYAAAHTSHGMPFLSGHACRMMLGACLQRGEMQLSHVNEPCLAGT